MVWGDEGPCVTNGRATRAIQFWWIDWSEPRRTLPTGAHRRDAPPERSSVTKRPAQAHFVLEQAFLCNGTIAKSIPTSGCLLHSP